MKKLIITLCFLFGATYSYSQKDDCIIDEQVLIEELQFKLNKIPSSGINKRTALKIIRNQIPYVLIDTVYRKVLINDFPIPKTVDSITAKKVALVPAVNDLPRWQITTTKLVALENKTPQDDIAFLIAVSVCMAVSFLVGFFHFKVFWEEMFAKIKDNFNIAKACTFYFILAAVISLITLIIYQTFRYNVSVYQFIQFLVVALIGFISSYIFLFIARFIYEISIMLIFLARRST